MWRPRAQIHYHRDRSPPPRTMRPRGIAIVLPLLALCPGVSAQATAPDQAHPVEDYSAAAAKAANRPEYDDFARDLYPRGGRAAPPPSANGPAAGPPAAPARGPAAVATAQEHPLDLSIRLPGVTVNGRRDAFSDSDQRLRDLQAALPCAGCDGRRHDDPPRLVQLGATLAIATVRSLLFSQPRVRGEPNDEALYLSHEGVCTPDDPLRCLARPQLP